MLLGSKNGERVYMRFDYIKEGMMQMAKYLVDNKASITAKLKEMKKPTLAKLELEKERLYENLEGLPLSERLEVYGQISDIRFRIEKLSKLSEMIENYMKTARKLSTEFDIIMAKELFSSLVVKKFEMHLIISIGGNKIESVPDLSDIFHSYDKEIIHLFNKIKMRLILHIR